MLGCLLLINQERIWIKDRDEIWQTNDYELMNDTKLLLLLLINVIKYTKPNSSN